MDYIFYSLIHNKGSEKMKYKNSKNFLYFLLIFIGVFLLNAIVIPIFSVNFLGYENLSRYKIYISTITQIIIIFVTGIIILMNTGDKLKADIKITLKLIPNLLVSSVLVFLFSRLVTDGIKWIYIGVTNDFSSIEIQTGMNVYTFIIAIIFLAMIPAICEEMLYRVAIYSLLKKYNLIVILLSSSFSFSLAHIPAGWGAVMSSLLLGYILIKNYSIYKNYFSVIAIHFLYNLLTLFFTYRIFWITDCAYISTRASSGVESIFWGLIYISIAIILLAILLFIAALRNKRQYFLETRI